jgi:hypothetical protein
LTQLGELAPLLRTIQHTKLAFMRSLLRPLTLCGKLGWQ